MYEVYESNHAAGYPVHFKGTQQECYEWILRNEFRFVCDLWTQEQPAEYTERECIAEALDR